MNLDCLPQEQSKNSVMGSFVGSGVKEATWSRTITSFWIPATGWSDAQLQDRQSAGVRRVIIPGGCTPKQRILDELSIILRRRWLLGGCVRSEMVKGRHGMRRGWQWDAEARNVS